jgi:hypothetical protein
VCDTVAAGPYRVKTTMHCIRCGRVGLFDHVVVRLADRFEAGYLCDECAQGFTGLFECGEPSGRCALCHRVGAYALPQWDLVAREDDGTVRWLEYDVTPEAPTLCEEHIDSLTTEETGAARRRERRHVTATEATEPP